MSEPWWKRAVVYQIYPRSFCDASGDGVGDLAGIEAHLDHLAGLGIDAIWLSPIFPSPMRDFGYDVADYCGVDALFGSLDDFDRLLAACHARGLRVLLDWVPNHTSDRHPWFQESRASRTSPKRDWYVWRDGTRDHPPNNWRAAWGQGPAWSWDEATAQWYLHLFLPSQPDLDWSNPEVEAAMHDTLRFWLERGVDGFRMDVIHCIGKDPALPDLPEDVKEVPACALNDDPRTHPLLRRIRALLDAYPGDRVAVGEVYLLDTDRMAEYYGEGDELHLSFNFPPLWSRWRATSWRRHVERTERALAPRGAWPTWALSNHDHPRQRTRYGSEARARAAALLLLTLRGTAFLYAGEELGLEDAEVPEAERVDPGGRDGCRAPIPWDETPHHGWAAEPWLPWPPHAAELHAAAQSPDPDSMLGLYQRLLAARRASPALQLGAQSWIETPEGVLGWRRAHGDDERIALVNFEETPAALSLDRSWRIEVASDGRGEDTRFSGSLGPDRALLLRPAG